MNNDRAPDLIFNLLVLIQLGIITYWTSPYMLLIVNCKSAPPQYRFAGSWIDSARHCRCAKDGETGEKGYLFYADGIIAP